MTDKFTFEPSKANPEGLYHKSEDGKIYWRFPDWSEVEITADDLRALAARKAKRDH